MTNDPLDYHRYPPSQRPHRQIARRAGALMIALGMLVLISGGCVFMASSIPVTELPADKQEAIHQLELASHVTLHQMFIIMGVVLGVVAVYQIVMGLFVRRGGKASIVTAIVITALVATVWAFELLWSLASGNSPNVGAGAGMLLLTLCLFAWQLAWLIQALHAARGGDNTPVYSQTTTAPGIPFAYPPPPPGPNPIGWPYPPPPTHQSR